MLRRFRCVQSALFVPICTQQYSSEFYRQSTIIYRKYFMYSPLTLITSQRSLTFAYPNLQIYSRNTYLGRDRFSAELRYDIVLDLDQILRRERGQRNIHFPCSAHHEHRISHLTRLIYTLARVDVCVTKVPGAGITVKLSGATEPLSGAMFVKLFV